MVRRCSKPQQCWYRRLQTGVIRFDCAAAKMKKQKLRFFVFFLKHRETSTQSAWNVLVCKTSSLALQSYYILCLVSFCRYIYVTGLPNWSICGCNADVRNEAYPWQRYLFAPMQLKIKVVNLTRQQRETTKVRLCKQIAKYHHFTAFLKPAYLLKPTDEWEATAAAWQNPAGTRVQECWYVELFRWQMSNCFALHRDGEKWHRLIINTDIVDK